MRKAFEPLLKKINTREELIFFLEEINRVREMVFKKVKIPLSEKLKGKIGEEFRKYLQYLEKEEVISKNPDQQASFLDDLKKYLQSIPEVKLEIAFLPSKDFTLKISSWFEKELRQKIILDLSVNPKIVGGITIEYQGRFRNFSLAKKIDELSL